MDLTDDDDETTDFELNYSGTSSFVFPAVVTPCSAVSKSKYNSSAVISTIISPSSFSTIVSPSQRAAQIALMTQEEINAEYRSTLANIRAQEKIDRAAAEKLDRISYNLMHNITDNVETRKRKLPISNRNNSSKKF